MRAIAILKAVWKASSDGKLKLDLNAAPKRSNKKQKGPKAPDVERKVEIALADIEKANLVPEI